MLTQIMTHLGLPRDPAQREEPATDAASLDVLVQLQQLQTHHHHSSEVVRFHFDFCIVTNFINCLLILIRVCYVLAIVGSDIFVFSLIFMY